MKVCELLDKIFFGGADKTFLPLIKNFAGDDDAEIFGINEDYAFDDTRVLITASVEDNKQDNGKKLFDLYLANASGYYEKIGSNAIHFYRDEILTLYGLIMSDNQAFQVANSGKLNVAAHTLGMFMQKEIQKQNDKKQKQ